MSFFRTLLIEAGSHDAERTAWHQAEGIHGITSDVPGKLIATVRR